MNKKKIKIMRLSDRKKIFRTVIDRSVSECTGADRTAEL